MSIKRRLLVILSIAILTVWSGSAIKTYYDARNEIQSLFDAQMEQSAQVLMSLSLHELYEQLAYQGEHPLGKPKSVGPSGKRNVVEQITPFIHKYGQQVAFQIYAGDELVIRSQSAPEKPLSPYYNAFHNRFIDEKRWRVYALQDKDAQIAVHVGELAERRDQLSAGIAFRVLAYVAITLPLIGVIIWFGVGRALKPLNNVAQAVNIRELDNLQEIDPDQVPSEAKPLVMALNNLFRRLQHAVENIRSFTSDAAHELRTPLAAVSTHAQLAIRAQQKDEVQAALKQVLKSVDRATHLIEQLLTMARLDPESYVEKIDHANLKQITERVLAELAPKAIEKNIDLSLDVEYEGDVLGKAKMLEILVGNLVENAIKYTPENGTVSVAVTQWDGNICLKVEDSGPGIPEEDRPNVFKRFFRRKGETTQGTGLGLSIVQRIAEIHHAEVKLERSKFNGLEVDIFFPKAA